MAAAAIAAIAAAERGRLRFALSLAAWLLPPPVGNSASLGGPVSAEIAMRFLGAAAGAAGAFAPVEAVVPCSLAVSLVWFFSSFSA